MCLSRFLMATHLNVLVNEHIFYAVRAFDMTFQMVFELVSFAAFFTLEGPWLIVTWHVDVQHIVCDTFVSAYVTLEWPLFWMDTPHVVFQMTTSYTWKNTQSALFWFFSWMDFLVVLQITFHICWEATQVAFVWFFSHVFYGVAFQTLGIRKGVVTLIAHKRLLSSNTGSMRPNMSGEANVRWIWLWAISAWSSISHLSLVLCLVWPVVCFVLIWKNDDQTLFEKNSPFLGVSRKEKTRSDKSWHHDITRN